MGCDNRKLLQELVQCRKFMRFTVPFASLAASVVPEQISSIFLRYHAFLELGSKQMTERVGAHSSLGRTSRL
jgi:hypothetical protein